MNFEYETSRLKLKILNDQTEYILQVLDFFKRNRSIFEKYEPLRAENFYTENYHATLLHCEHELFLKLHEIRYWIYEKTDPNRIIGTVCFHNIIRSEFQRCTIGYKLDRDFWHLGMAKEAVSFLVTQIFKDLGLHRIEAYVMPKNLNSIYLLDSLGFKREGLCRHTAKIQGRWTDHFLYALISEDKEADLSFSEI
ncbi:MAG: GNAT family N-acetyltransferase [Roseburia sp.]|nr:GNAT family N-acetyltransferase [Roseburia sp.]